MSVERIREILIEQLWPGGLSKGNVAYDELTVAAKAIAVETDKEILAFIEQYSIRNTLEDFVPMMERSMLRNDWKGGWESDDPDAVLILLGQVFEEADELEQAVLNGDSVQSALEASDVATAAMMVADLMKGIPYDEERYNGRPVAEESIG